MNLSSLVQKSVGRAIGAAGAVRLLSGGRARTTGAVVFAYHDIGQRPNGTEYFVTDTLLREHLDAARHWGLRFVDLGRLLDAHAAGQDLSGLAAVTFDDGLLGVQRHALGVLADLEIPATVFVVADALGQDPWWYPGSERLLTRDELEAIVAAGHSIGSHTMTHSSLPELDAESLATELRDSRTRLEDMFSTPVDILAYPSGHHDALVRSVALATGYRAAFTFLNGRITAGLDPFRLPRLTMSDRQQGARLAYHLARPAWGWPDHQVDVLAADAPLH